MISEYDFLIRQLEELSNKYKNNELIKQEFLDKTSEVCKFYESHKEVLSNKADSKIIDLKILPQFYKDVEEGKKTFEVRKNDRDYKVGDAVILNEWDNGYTGNFLMRRIVYILDDPEFIKDDYVILGLR